LGNSCSPARRSPATAGGGEQRVVVWYRERRKEVEEEADVWVPHVSELKVEKLQGYFGSYGNTFVCKWVQGHQRRIKWHDSKK